MSTGTTPPGDHTEPGTLPVTGADETGAEHEAAQAHPSPENEPQEPAHDAQDALSADASEVERALAQITDAETTASISVGQQSGTYDYPPVKVDRLSIERRVLGHITDEVEHSAIGSRNTLAALTYSISRDLNTTNPKDPTLPRLSTEGGLGGIAQRIAEHIETLVGHGLVEKRDDGSYALTDAGHKELSS